MLNERQKYLLNRQKFIGGSDVAAAMGISKYKTRMELYIEKTIYEPIDISNEKMDMGNIIEPIIIKRFYDLPEICGKYDDYFTGRQFVIKKHRYIKPTPDLILLKYEFYEPNLEIPVDVKNAECRYKNYSDWDIPVDYFAQLQCQIAACDAPYGYLVVLFNGWHLEHYKIERNQNFIDSMLESVNDFWFNYVKKGIIPPPDNNQEANYYYKATQGSSIEAISEISSLVRIYKILNEQIKELETQAEGLELDIKRYIGENETLTIDGEPVIRWRYNKDSLKFNSKKYLVENKIDNKYFEITKGARPFRILGD